MKQPQISLLLLLNLLSSIIIIILTGSSSTCSASSVYYVQAYMYDYPTCGDCWCAPSEDDCPDWEPISDYPVTVQDTLRTQSSDFIYTLVDDCNPYVDSDCETEPTREYVELGDEAACGLHYYNKCSRKEFLFKFDNHHSDSNNNAINQAANDDDDDEICYWFYRMESYPSWGDAEADGAFVTHTGACGVCSTTWDLAGYMNNPTLEEDSIKCTLRGLKDFDDGIQCYIDAGLTEECAKMWLYDGYHTTKECTEICVAEIVENEGDVPANGPPPECELSSCLQCDEDESGPIFKEYVGRIRRSSGLLSSIVRPCEGFPQIIHVSVMMK